MKESIISRSAMFSLLGTPDRVAGWAARSLGGCTRRHHSRRVAAAVLLLFGASAPVQATVFHPNGPSNPDQRNSSKSSAFHRHSSKQSPPSGIVKYVLADSIQPLGAGKAPGASEARTELSIAAATDLKLSGPSEATFNAGAVSLLDRNSIEKIFSVENVSGGNITISYLRGSCGCTTGVILADPMSQAAALPTPAGTLISLAPHQKAMILARVDLTHMLNEPVEKSLFVFLANETKPAATLNIAGQVTAGVAFDPPQLDFGDVSLDRKQIRTVTVSVDQRLVSSDKLPNIVSSDPSIVVQPLNVPTHRTSTKVYDQTFTVAISPNAPLGPILGQITFAPPAANAEIDTKVATLLSASLPVSGAVTGNVVAQPQSAEFGVVKAGAGSTIGIAFFAKSVGGVGPITATSNSQYIVLQQRKGVSALSQYLDVAISKTAPVGLLRAQVSVALSDGETLVVPVGAFIQKGP